MHIAFITTEYITESTFDGGLANYLHRIVLSMSQRGHNVEVFTRAIRDEILIHRGVMVHRVGPSRRLEHILKRLTRGKLNTFVKTLTFGLSVRRCLLAQHQKSAFDIAQATSLLASGLSLTHLSPVPMVVRISSYTPHTRQARYVTHSQTSDTVLSDFLARYALRHASGVYAPSRLLSAIIERETGVPTSVVRPPFFVETDEIDPSVYDQHLKDKPYLLYFGTVNRLKGCVVLAEALSLALQRHSDLRFVIVGKTEKMADGKTYLDHILEMTGANADRVHCIGRLAHTQLYPVIAGAKGVILPSLLDNLPNTCMEAMSQGRVVVGTYGTSFEELIEPGVSGLLVPPGNVQALFESMSRVWTMSDSEQERIGSNAKHRILRGCPKRLEMDKMEG